jgi:hypothetical protein
VTGKKLCFTGVSFRAATVSVFDELLHETTIVANKITGNRIFIFQI